MKKILLFVMISLSGCASVSEYNQGCRDGVKTFIIETGANATVKIIDSGCNILDSLHKENKNIEEKDPK